MKNKIQKLSLAHPAVYHIKVPGEPDQAWAEWSEDISIHVERNTGNHPITTLIGTFDQAALQGLLRRLYSQGVPLISVNCVDLC
ncbi:MAG: hypothetical protein JEZ06_16825 [Anaerolineaceae bacterium]|nr:hypothetical protein [Anaerolineaceae bacterium]